MARGVKFRGDGEWLARKHGPSRRRQWRKVHIAMDTETGDIRAVEFTSSRQGDSSLLPDLLAQIPEDEEIATVTGDGAYDTRRCRTAIIERGADAVIPIRRNGRAWKEDCPAALGIVLGPMADNPRRETRSYAQHGTSVGHSGRSGRATMSEAASRRR
ncbi:hypothetical protein GCM10008024_30640 [Allgaiera indica]|uniref:Transposase IS4-like domain-containing protein n=1 Tax=Allgaiera indica TaxID=765699 RepID=A0AAN4UTQ5_9RHOB|nr:hypothetical protein GCM10008024_30640 [Allgaiera indica]